mmetsp:Transcript_1805/g.4462  ORF Transcript_1805/g.4462 Transcript_1805/m.4462 type:complete len:345 (-) Transcript_1805:75-1109(-)
MRSKHASLSGRLVIFNKPIHCLLNSIIDGCELIIGTVFSHLLVACRLFELPVGLGAIKFDLAFELHGFGNGVRDVLDADFLFFVDADGDGGWVVVLAQHPDGQLGEILRVNELAQRRAAAPYCKRRSVLFRQVAFVNEAGDDMARLDVEIVMRSVNVGGDDGCEVASVLFCVRSVQRVDESLGVRVPLVGWMRRAVVEHGLVDGVRGFVGKDACRQHADQLLDLVDAAAFHDVVVDEDVDAEEFHLLGHVGEESTDHGGQMDDVRRLVLLEDGLRRLAVAEVAILGTQEDPCLVAARIGGGVLRFPFLLDVRLDAVSDKSGAARHQDNPRFRFRRFFRHLFCCC